MATQTATTTRRTVHVDEDKCDGCALCVPACAMGDILDTRALSKEAV